MVHSNGKILWKNPQVKELVKLTRRDQIFMDHILKNVLTQRQLIQSKFEEWFSLLSHSFLGEHHGLETWDGSDGWLRASFGLYLKSFLSAILNDVSTDDYGVAWRTCWEGTASYQEWKLRTDSVSLPIV